MGLTYDGRPVKVVEVEVTAKFTAYVFDDREQVNAGSERYKPTLAESIAHNVADAIEYRAPDLSDSHELTGLIAVAETVRGGEQVIATYREIESAATDEDLINAIEGTEAEL